MQLHARDLGGPPDAPALVLLHGLLGSSRNWVAAGRQFAGHFRVFALDARNHGESPHDPVHTYAAMAADVANWIRLHEDRPVHLLGHSMGGKTAMLLACRHPELIARLVIVDIVPKDYFGSNHHLTFRALQNLELGLLSSREDADRHLEPAIPDWAFRRFLLTNLERQASGWRWIVNLDVLASSLREIEKDPLDRIDLYPGPALFVFGGNSNYFQGGDHVPVQRHFPAAELEFIDGSGHSPHFDRPQEFCACVKRFLLSSVSTD
jgi:pimeloyl-ACP methyl ester carboxylesterase